MYVHICVSIYVYKIVSICVCIYVYILQYTSMISIKIKKFILKTSNSFKYVQFNTTGFILSFPLFRICNSFSMRNLLPLSNTFTYLLSPRLSRIVSEFLAHTFVRKKLRSQAQYLFSVLRIYSTKYNVHKLNGLFPSTALSVIMLFFAVSFICIF